MSSAKIAKEKKLYTPESPSTRRPTPLLAMRRGNDRGRGTTMTWTRREKKTLVQWL